MWIIYSIMFSRLVLDYLDFDLEYEHELSGTPQNLYWHIYEEYQNSKTLLWK